MMRPRKPTLCLLFILLSLISIAQTNSTKDKQRLQQTVSDFFDALSARDSNRLKSYAAPDILLFENGAVWNLDSLLLKAIRLNTDPSFKRSNSFSFLSTTIRKTTGWVSYKLVSEFYSNNKQRTAHWMETVIAIKEKGKWKIKVLHSTLIKRT